MKLILLAAAAIIATPALAQSSGSTGTSSPTSNGGQGTAATPAVQNNPQGTTPSDPSTMTPAPSSQSMPDQSTPSQSMPSPSMPTQPSGSTPAGGYAPSTMPTGAQPGGTVRFQQAPSPDQAYPAPAPLASYPICKPGQFDQCMQASGSTHSRAVRHRRSR